jgi:hypothetical protein
MGAAVVTAIALIQAEATAKAIYLRGPDREAAWIHHFDLTEDQRRQGAGWRGGVPRALQRLRQGAVAS